MPTIMVQHTKADMSLWTGRVEPFETQRARYWYQLAQPYDFDKAGQRVGLVGFACDQGVRRNQGRIGARAAPPLLKSTFASLPVIKEIQDSFEGKLTTLMADAGDIECKDNDTLAEQALEQAQQRYADVITSVIKQGSLAIGLGGGHAIAYGSFLGLWQAMQTAPSDQDKIKAQTVIGIINFDAHLDIRAANAPTSGTPFRQIAEHLQAFNQPFHYCCIGVSRLSNTAALFDRADDLGVQIISDEDCNHKKWKKLASQITNFIEQVDIIYLTIDMDCLPASVVPGVSAPAAYGINLGFVERAVKLIMDSGKVKIADIAEINPTYDIDNRSCKVAARLLSTIVERYLLTI
ncbi:formimidoylglutamase [Psychrobacter sp. Ps3]|uniref:formimidoylglutamase n=1 Tax=Psychrobacter sp. Ps3 TaxID=2790957 RepID=UPI001EDF6EC9|nr:formimidoylglutamase [Psychrobacter sp. Ps3]MCG3881624.1 formimidoylglutamase [Psychrobacter sp. Ps3]